MTTAANLGLEAPRYQQLAQSLATSIEHGEYQVGSLLPGEEMLCRLHGMSRHTVREALRHLQGLGLIEKRHGIGTAVLASTPPRAFAHTLGSVEEVRQYAKDTRLVDHRCTMVTADAELAAVLPCAPGARLLRIEAMRIASGRPANEPLAWSCIHVVERYAGIRSKLKAQHLAIGTLIEQQFGEQITAVEQDIHAVSIDADIARALHVKTGSAGLRVDRRYLGADGKPFEWATSIHPGPRFGLSMRLDRAGGRARG